MEAAPHLIIEPPRAWGSLNLSDVWQYRELLYFLTLRDVKVRYKQTALGIAWALIQPLSTMLVFSVFFGRLAKLPSDGIPYPIFAYAGLLPWTFFANAVTNSASSLVGSSNLITKVYFPRVIIPGAAVAAALVDFAIAFALLGVMMVWYQVPVGPNVLLLPALTLLTSIFALGLGMWLSALNVRFRDIRYVIPFAIQIGMFVTPIIYPGSLIPERYRGLLALNPMAGIVDGFRVALLSGLNGARFDWTALGASLVIALALLLYAAYDFRRMERSFADLV